MLNPCRRIQRTSPPSANAKAFAWIMIICQLLPPPPGRRRHACEARTLVGLG